MEILEANAQYNDLIGDSALDGHISSPLHDLAKFCDVPDEYIPIGMSVYFGELGFFNLNIYAYPKSKYGSNVQELNKHREVITKRFNVDIPYTEFMRIVKRFSITLRNKHLRNIKILIEDD